MSDNFETLFKKSSLNQVMNYQKVILGFRKNKKSRKDKIDAIHHQLKYMNLMNNTGAELNGHKKFNKANFSDDFFKNFDNNDVNTLYRAIHIPYTKSKKSFLRNIQKAYGHLQYFEFITSSQPSNDNGDVSVVANTGLQDSSNQNSFAREDTGSSASFESQTFSQANPKSTTTKIISPKKKNKEMAHA